MAPNWFAPAIAQAMTQAMTPLVQQLNQMQKSLNALNLQSMRAFNRSVMHPEDVLSPLGGVEVLHFPTTFNDLRNISSARSQQIIQSYNIDGNFTNVQERRRAIANFIGIIRY